MGVTELASNGYPVSVLTTFDLDTLITDTETDLGERLLQGLTAQGYRVRSFSRIQPSLEDVFLAATRRSWDARLPDKKNQPGDDRAPLPKA